MYNIKNNESIITRLKEKNLKKQQEKNNTRRRDNRLRSDARTYASPKPLLLFLLQPVSSYSSFLPKLDYCTHRSVSVFHVSLSILFP